MPETPAVTLRYFDCRGRAQALRDVLIDAGVAFRDERVPIDSNWPSLKADPTFSGPFGSLPVLTWGEDTVAQTLAIAGYLARRLGRYDGLDACSVARIEMAASAAYLELIQPVGELLYQWGAPAEEDAWRGWFAGYVQRLHARARAFDSLLAQGPAFLGGEAPAAADYLLLEAIIEWREFLGPSLLGALDPCPRLAGFIESLQARATTRGCFAEGRRPAVFSGSPRDSESLQRLRAEAARLTADL